MEHLTHILITSLIGLVAWIGSRLWNKVDQVGAKLDEHNSAAIERLSRVETKVDGMEDRVEHIERIVLKRA
jgi:hypothetical protein